MMTKYESDGGFIQITNSILLVCNNRMDFCVTLSVYARVCLSPSLCVYKRMSALTFPYVWIPFKQSIEIYKLLKA